MSVTSLTSSCIVQVCVHYNVLLEMMMSVLQEVKGLTKKLYFVTLLVGRPVPMQNFRLNVYMVYLF